MTEPNSGAETTAAPAGAASDEAGIGRRQALIGGAAGMAGLAGLLAACGDSTDSADNEIVPRGDETDAGSENGEDSPGAGEDEAGAGEDEAGAGEDEAGNEEAGEKSEAVAGAEVLTGADDVPVGGGVVVGEAGVVVTQPESGEFRGFSSTCTHEGCQVSDVDDGLIRCFCHGSRFSIVDGSVENGPATDPLPVIGVTLADGQILRG